MNNYKSIIGNNSVTIILFATAVAIIALSLSLWALNSQQRFAFIDNSILVQNYKEAKLVREKIEKKREEWGKNAKALEDSVNVISGDLMERGLSMNKAELQKKKEQLEKRREDYVRYVRAVSEKAAKMETDEMQPVFNELNASVKEYAKRRGYSLVFGTVAGGNILYGSEAVDITQEFLEFVNQK